jgi:hypothetical protein
MTFINKIKAMFLGKKESDVEKLNRFIKHSIETGHYGRVEYIFKGPQIVGFREAKKPLPPTVIYVMD